jgi:hypothetical protein
VLKRLATIAILIAATAFPAAAASIKGSIRQAADGVTKQIAFDVTSTTSGRGSGEVTATGLLAAITGDSEESAADAPVREFSVTIDVNCFNGGGNRVAVSGAIRSSSEADYVGRVGMLVVQDDGTGNGKWAFSLFKHVTATIVPTDSERADDTGSSYSWTATDAERGDDAGVPNSRAQEIDCRFFPLSAHSLTELKPADGSVHIQQ